MKGIKMSLVRSNGGFQGVWTVSTRLVAAVVGLVSLLVLLTSCGGTSGPESQDELGTHAVDLWPMEDGGALTAIREGCGVLSGPTVPGGHFIFTLTDPVLPSHAPIPHNGSERVVFAQLYETLVQVDCTGETKPGLAESWTCEQDSTFWVFTIREGARFWDGTRITTEDVNRSLSGNLAQAVTVMDARRVAVHLPEPHARFPKLLAHPSAAVSVIRPGWTWPVGSGPCRLRASDPAPLPDLACLPNQNHPAAPAWKSLTFRVLPGTDPRDLVATDMDLTLVRDMNEVGFFNDAPGFRSVPLPWNRLYLLVCPPDMNSLGADRWIMAAAKMDVGRDVTAVSARSWPEIFFPAGGDGNCPGLSGPDTGGQSARLDWNLAAKNLDLDVLAYPGGDAGAREMARRLGALAGGSVRTAALPDDSVDFVLQWQMAGALILPLDQQYPTGCLQMASLLGKASWLSEAALGLPAQPDGDSLAAADKYAAQPQVTPAKAVTRQDLVRPLGLGRSWLIVRGSLAGLKLAYDGTPLLAGLGAAATAVPGEATP